VADATRIPPARRPDLVLRPTGEKGQHVVKDPATGTYYNLGAQEAFLLLQLDGRQSVAAVCAAFRERFGEALTEEDLDGFLDLARSRAFLLNGRTPAPTAAAPATPAPAPPPAPRRTGQSILYWRKNVFDPDRLFNWLEPKVRFLWTSYFLVVSLLVIAAAGVLTWMSRGELVSHFPGALRWETLVAVWLTVVVTTTLHEFAHGLTCKRYGGEVHELGFLLMFFIPCFYCNVSDAWLFKEKSKRLLVTLAGAYCDLCLWAVSVFVWRLTVADTLLYHVAWVALSVCGARIFFNFNPLMKLDGYYLLSDWAEIPNLRNRSWALVQGHLRRLLWGGPKPEPEPRALFLLGYGVGSWLFSVTYVVLMLLGLVRLFGMRWGVVGVGLAVVLAVLMLRNLLGGLTGGEVAKMIRFRRIRTLVWVLVLAAVPAVLYFGHTEDKASGSFVVRPATRAELRAPVAGFLAEVYADEGDPISVGYLVARIEVPDLASRIAQKHAEVQEALAKVQLLEAGPRPEEVAEQRAKVQRGRDWRDRAREDLDRARRALKEDLVRLDQLIAQHKSELAFAEHAKDRDEKLYGKDAVSKDEYRLAVKDFEVHKAQLEQDQAQRRGREALGTVEPEAELGRRDKDLADAESLLKLLELGNRPEAIEAERAHLARLKEEERYLETLQGKLQVYSPVPGVVVTPHLKEKVGQYLKEGDLIGTVEEPALLEVEISLNEQDLARVRPGQAVELKARALPFRTFDAQVTRLAPGTQRAEAVNGVVAAVPAHTDSSATLTVYSEVENGSGELRPGMTGYARIRCGDRSFGEILLERGLRYLRTEFWW
jgi:putative peptide zinc metalloprotease protein